VTRINAETVRDVLNAHGVAVLHVTDSDLDGGRVVAYLHGNAGQNQQETAIRCLNDLDGVQRVEASSASWTILIVRLSAGGAGVSGP
jgi:hypothetical protein